MTERSYKVAEIDQLRLVCEEKLIWGNYHGGFCGQSSSAGTWVERVVAVEAMVRTHMMAGHTAEDLLASQEPYPDDEDD